MERTMHARPRIFVVAFAIGIVAYEPAFADDVAHGWYVLPTYHQTHLDNANVKFRSTTTQFDGNTDFGDDTHPGIAVGYAFDSPYRIDVAYMSHSNDTKEKGTAIGDQSLDADTVVAAVWRDFPLAHHLAPYVGVGLGYASLKLANLDGNTYLGQLGAGIEWSFSRRFALDVGYLYQVSESSPDLNGGGAKLTTDYTAQSAQIGLRYTFWPR